MDEIARIRARLVLAARVIITDHWPTTDRPDWCPICNCPWKCWPLATAYAYLRLEGQHLWTPPHAR
ncbi:hypothetical protein [Verrucosispora sp. TAA-831]|uniref:hypothetical protein n=1 Tax=Verrucosispora sp. TAA-831 TaxID=3422227 RepID=UPI003D6EFB3C